jgi:2-methylisocitrate lyase-like PEP mutase family enzyme
MSLSSPGAKFRAALAAEKPLQVPGAICAYHAILAESLPGRWASPILAFPASTMC